MANISIAGGSSATYTLGGNYTYPHASFDPLNQSPFLNNAAAATTKEQMVAIINGRISEIKKEYGNEFLERVKKMVNLRELIESLSPSQEEKLVELWDIALEALT